MMSLSSLISCLCLALMTLIFYYISSLLESFFRIGGGLLGMFSFEGSIGLTVVGEGSGDRVNEGEGGWGVMTVVDLGDLGNKLLVVRELSWC